ncbi:hypothetical protein I2I11_13685 [Pontibacter sp. 172403-2]|uniref:hypothetical protein n=1 Tax=Pontibacter rufus TaxID=2791028 RepID=UPI0018AF5AF0|nr:hypothetical protein [Pontibacter sp. 172403-2]MBF9254352.1 hypothetical protein [Pontibacter sp. 172403-2]
MKKNLLKHTLLLAFAATACQPNTDEGKTIASTHPELEKQLARDSVKTPISSNENPDLYDQYRITLQEYESSGNYAVTDMYSGRLSPLDEADNAEAHTYKTALNEGLKEGVNFAGKYTVVTIGCGTGCQTHYVVDRETGRVLDKVQSSIGAKYSPDSRLFIINPPDSAINYNECQDCAPRAYVFEDGKFREAAPNR